MKLGPKLYPARAGQGYVALARRDYDAALKAFDAALEGDASYVPALVGKGQTLLARSARPTWRWRRSSAALIVDPSLTDLNRRVEVLRFRNVQDVIDAAQTGGEGRTA